MMFGEYILARKIADGAPNQRIVRAASSSSPAIARVAMATDLLDAVEIVQDRGSDRDNHVADLPGSVPHQSAPPQAQLEAA